MARCGEGVGLGFAAQRAGGDGLASRDAGRFRFVGFLPVMSAAIRAGSPGTAGDHVIDVVRIAALDNGNVLVSVGDGYRIAGFGSHRIAAVLVVVGPIGDIGGFAGGGVEKLVSGFVDDAGIVCDLSDLTVVADYAIVAGDAGGAGIYVVYGISRGKGLYTLKRNIVCRSAIIGRPRIIKWEIKSSIDPNIVQRNG